MAMKNFIFILAMALFLISCSNANHTQLTNQEKTMIQSEISPIVEQIKTNAEAGNVEKVCAPNLNSPDFIAIENGQIMDYNQFWKALKKEFEVTKSQKFNEHSVRFSYLNRKNVIVTWTGTNSFTLHNGREGKYDPFTASFVFVKSAPAATPIAIPLTLGSVALYAIVALNVANTAR